MAQFFRKVHILHTQIHTTHSSDVIPDNTKEIYSRLYPLDSRPTGVTQHLLITQNLLHDHQGYYMITIGRRMLGHSQIYLYLYLYMGGIVPYDTQTGWLGLYELYNTFILNIGP